MKNPDLYTAALVFLMAGCHVNKHYYSDNFDSGELSASYIAELQDPEKSTVRVVDGQLDIDVGAGATIWLDTQLTAPIAIEYEATPISEAGPNDRVSDLNCFWMATDSLGNSPTGRSGRFKDYHQLYLYYTGYGGHNNSKTRFRRYDGNTDRKLLPEHDLSDPQYLLVPNKTYRIKLVVKENIVQYIRDGEVIFEINDPAPYHRGWFGWRTVRNHLRIDNLRIYRP